MASRSRLAQYVLDRITDGGETPEEFAIRVGINPSGLYKFLRGAYAEPRQTTLDKIAGGLRMTPAELLVAIGKGATDADPQEVELLALFRRVPADKRPAATDMLRGLAVQPTRPVANRRQQVEENRKRAAVLKMNITSEQGEEHVAKRDIPPWYRRATDFAHVLSAQLAPALAPKTQPCTA